jgi:hypothetical protein
VKYMLLIYSNSTVWESLSDAERTAVGDDHATLIAELRTTGEWVGGSALADPSRTTTVRVRDGVDEPTDGPFAEAKEHLAGYDLVDCATPERAREIAARIPDARLVAVEVRPVVEEG